MGKPDCEVCGCFEKAGYDYTPCCHVRLCNAHFDELYECYYCNIKCCDICIEQGNGILCNKCTEYCCEYCDKEYHKCTLAGTIEK